jgi:serine/threonine-protein kinase
VNDDPVTVTQTSGPGVTTWGPLSVLQEIGRGGFGRVYRAWDPVLAREVALKIIQPFEPDAEVLAAILREGQLLARVRHHNVVTIHGALQIENEVGLWMELVRGRSLDDLVKHDGPRAAEEAAVIGSSLCLALAAVHQAGVVHRDVKAHNVMRESGGRIVLMDFGAGALLTERRAQHEHPVGTPVYMAPEVLAGASATVRSDIYSLGVLLYYLVTGTYPVLGRTWTDFLMAHARQERRALADVRPDLAPRFVRIVERATSAHPDERYATPGTMLRDLTDLIAGGEPPTARRATPATDSRRRKKGRPRSREKRAWWVAAMIAAPIAGMWLLGALASAAFNNTLDRPS